MTASPYNRPWIVYARFTGVVHSRHESRERAMQTLLIVSDDLFSNHNEVGWTYKHLDDMDDALRNRLGVAITGAEPL